MKAFSIALIILFAALLVINLGIRDPYPVAHAFGAGLSLLGLIISLIILVSIIAIDKKRP